MSIETLTEEQLEELLSTRAERLGYKFHVEEMDDGQWFTSFAAPADRPEMRPLRSGATGHDRRSALQVLAYVVTNPGVKVPRGSLPP